MRIGELAQSLGMNSPAVRFYERAGLLPAPQRTEAGYRIYGEADLRRVRFIRKAKQLGFSLDEIGEILRLHDRGEAPCEEVISMAERHLSETEEEIARLERFRQALARSVRQWKRRRPRHVAGRAICELIEQAVLDADTPPPPRHRARRSQ